MGTETPVNKPLMPHKRETAKVLPYNMSGIPEGLKNITEDTIFNKLTTMLILLVTAAITVLAATAKRKKKE